MQYSWLRVGEGSISPQACQERPAAVLRRPALAEHRQFWYSVTQHRSRFAPVLPQVNVRFAFGISQRQAPPPPVSHSSIPKSSTLLEKSVARAMNYTFAHFVVGSANQFAHAAALAVANLPSQAYNPLFLYGETGLGKTHLLQAIGHHISQSDATQRVVYLPVERFVNDLVSAIHRAQTAVFRQRYRNVDVLLIDDVELLAGKKQAQEEFLHTFNTLHQADKQIVMSSDRAPLDITPLDERLRSRFAAGLIADLQPPDLETRLAILTRKAEARGIALPHDVAMLIASGIRGNIRELEDGLTRIIAFASLNAQPLSSELAETVLQQTLAERERAITAPRIQQAVARHFGIKISEMKSKGRQRTVTFPRQVAMFLCRELTDASFPRIGQAFGGKDHTTVLHSCEKIARLEEADEHVARLLWQLRRALKN